VAAPVAAAGPNGATPDEPAGPNVLDVSAPPAAPAVRYARFWRRVVARLVDSLLVGALIWGAGEALRAVVGPIPLDPYFAATDRVWVLVSPAGLVALGFLLLAWLYWAGFDSSPLQGTPGRLVTRTRIAIPDRRRIGFGRASWRFWVQVLLAGLAVGATVVVATEDPLRLAIGAASGIVILLSYVLAAWTPRRRALHDLLAGTVVVRRG
jgi:uncharacterized RDD family membrane protein YckC